MSIFKKEQIGKSLGKASVVELYRTKEGRIKFYGLKIGDKYGCGKTGEPICSRDYRYVSLLAWRFNRKR